MDLLESCDTQCLSQLFELIEPDAMAIDEVLDANRITARDQE